MAYARTVTFRARPGKRENVVSTIDSFTGEGEELEGFMGITALLSTSDPDTGVMLTMWESEEALNSSYEGIVQKVMESVKEFLGEPPDIKHFRVREMTSQLIPVTT